MVPLYVLFATCVLAFVALGVRERRRHDRNLDEIPLRVLVNGSRGKSTITRLVTGALRGGGLRTVGKTTGTAARFLHVHGEESPIARPFGVANVAEQIRIVRHAVAERPEALVVECMAIDPNLQEVTQERLVRSRIGVISNVREDHLVEMGPTLTDVARSLSRSMPRDGVCVTSEGDLFPVLAEEAARRRCRLVYADPDMVSDEELALFDGVSFKENVAIALAIAGELGIPRVRALRGMLGVPADPGSVRVERFEHGGKSLHVANIFAANDPYSTMLSYEALLAARAIEPPFYTLINCRPDRMERNRQMAALVPSLNTEKLFVIGHPSRSAIAALPGGWDGDVIDLGGDRRRPEEILRSIVSEVPDTASLLAIGNIHGHGERLLAHLATAGGAR